MKALLSFAILITIFGEPFFTDGSPQPLDIDKLIPIDKKTLGSLLDEAKKAIAEKDGKSEFQNVPMKNQFHPKYQQKYFWISTLKFFVAFWGLPASFFGFSSLPYL